MNISSQSICRFFLFPINSLHAERESKMIELKWKRTWTWNCFLFWHLRISNKCSYICRTVCFWIDQLWGSLMRHDEFLYQMKTPTRIGHTSIFHAKRSVCSWLVPLKLLPTADDINANPKRISTMTEASRESILKWRCRSIILWRDFVLTRSESYSFAHTLNFVKKIKWCFSLRAQYNDPNEHQTLIRYRMCFLHSQFMHQHPTNGSEEFSHGLNVEANVTNGIVRIAHPLAYS